METEKSNAGKTPLLTADRLEILIAVFLGITALLMAWATWIGSLHGGNQATNYTKSNNLAAEGNAEYNAAMQLYMSDLMAWNTIMSYQFDIEIAEANGSTAEAELLDEKLEEFMLENCSEAMLDAIIWAGQQEDAASPFDMDGFVESYTDEANELLWQSQELLEEGQRDNTNGDKYGLVTVIYSVVLFLLGIVGIFKQLPNRLLVFWIAVAFLAVAAIYMLTIPLPTDFSFLGYFRR